MPALLISAVDPATDLLTSVAHGQNTGDGPATVYTPDGTYPGGLAPVTDVYFIRIDADHFKLATSNANALANVWIDITSAGTGTIYVLTGMPYRRARTYVAGAQVKSADLDAVQDSLTAFWAVYTGMNFPHHTKWYAFPRAPSETGIVYTDPAGNVEGIWDNAGGATWEGMVNLGLPPGTRITDFVAYVKGTGGVQNVQILINVWGPGIVFANFASISAVNPPAARTLYHATAFPPYVVTDGDLFSVRTLTHILNTGVYGFGVTVDRLGGIAI